MTCPYCESHDWDISNGEDVELFCEGRDNQYVVKSQIAHCNCCGKNFDFREWFSESDYWECVKRDEE